MLPQSWAFIYLGDIILGWLALFSMSIIWILHLTFETCQSHFFRTLPKIRHTEENEAFKKGQKNWGVILLSQFSFFVSISFFTLFLKMIRLSKIDLLGKIHNEQKSLERMPKRGENIIKKCKQSIKLTLKKATKIPIFTTFIVFKTLQKNPKLTTE